MYGLGNIERFVRTNGFVIGARANTILARAKELAQDGILPASIIPTVLDDPFLTDSFFDITTKCPLHIEIGFRAIKKAQTN